jgi:hypothetical protein
MEPDHSSNSALSRDDQELLEGLKELRETLFEGNYRGNMVVAKKQLGKSSRTQCLNEVILYNL